jgi:serine/threonine protein phosphatase Stp1
MTGFPLRAQSDARTHEGQVRELNEDSYCSIESAGFWAVADGMGGHENGEWASAVLVENLQGTQFPDDFDGACQQIAEAMFAANSTIFMESRNRGKQMGSTVVALYVRNRRFAVFWVGDSRCYLLRDGKLHQLSRDHSQVQEMVDRGLLRPEDAEGHPMGHVLARAVGVRPTLEVDAIEDEVEPGDIFLLCSDGLHGYVGEEEIRRLLSRGAPEETSRGLVALTLERGAPDNVTVITVLFTEPTMLSMKEPATLS